MIRLKRFSFKRCIVPEAAGVAGAVVGNVINMTSQHLTNAQNRLQAREAYYRQLAAVREQAAYNSPAMQVARLKAAGLSPSLAYGANGETVGNISDLPAYSPIPAEAPRSGDLGAAFNDAARVGLETREQLNRDNLAIAELALKDAQSFMYVTAGNKDAAQTEEIITLLGYKEQDYLNKFQLDSARYGEIVSNIDKNYSDILLNDKQVEELDSLIELNGARASEIYALLPHHIRNLDANTLMASMQAGLYKAEISEVAEKVATLQYGRQLEFWDRQFENRKSSWEREKFEKELKIRIESQHADRVTSIFRTLLGGAMIRSGVRGMQAPQRQPSPIITPAGGSMFGQNWSQ